SIENIIRNGIDAIDRNDGMITISLKKEGNGVNIQIKDNGRGIPKKDWKNIFRPGFSTKKSGWGLGLSLSMRIVQDIHKGRLQIRESTMNKGTIFEIIL
ncbi:MAG: ATP-binding protein, partial [Candidatus Neomarinimicrobiota bacterium]|nr:ATP-binding protein [Candidatus Neomarinimicrobiota bacterium]